MKEIKSRLKEFKSLPEKEYYKEFLFCLLTPQSNAQRCWQAVLELSKIPNPTQEQISNILKTKTRFHHTKVKRIFNARESFRLIKPLFKNPNKLELRNQIAEKVSGYGLKESGHFLRNIGHSNNQIAILDRHILKNLCSLDLIKEGKIKSAKHYLEIEQLFLNYAKQKISLQMN